jgi:hypothetical protein
LVQQDSDSDQAEPAQQEALRWKRLHHASILALVIHVLAGLAMLFVLRQGLDTGGSLNDRLTFMTEHRWEWTCGWLPWNAAALSILYLFHTFARAHGAQDRVAAQYLTFAVIVTATAVPCDLSAETIQMALLPSLSANLLNNPGASHDLFLALSRLSILLTGFLANALYTIAFLILILATRKRYNLAVVALGCIVVLTGVYLSYACLVASVSGMFWSNAIMLPCLVFWLLFVASSAANKVKALCA